MYDRLADLATRPEPFARTTTRELWTDPHIAAQMLRFHLDGGHDMASRRTGTIDGFVGWLDAAIGLSGRRVLDLGCGPGLYARRMAVRGATVTGLDFSSLSIAHARREAMAAGLSIDYREADYLAEPFPEGLDLVTLIYCDYGALPPVRRRHLLQKIRVALKRGGVLVLDAFPPGHMEKSAEGITFERRLMNGFFVPGDYFGFRARHLYADLDLTLDRYLIVAPEREFEVWNWDQCFAPENLAAELAEQGLAVERLADIATGATWQDGSEAFAVVARAV